MYPFKEYQTIYLSGYPLIHQDIYLSIRTSFQPSDYPSICPCRAREHQIPIHFFILINYNQDVHSSMRMYKLYMEDIMLCPFIQRVPTIHSLIDTSRYPFTHPCKDCQYILPSIHLSINLSIHLYAHTKSTNISIQWHPSIYPSFHLPIQRVRISSFIHSFKNL